MADTPITPEDPVDQALTEGQRAQIQRGLADAAAGRLIPHADVVAGIRDRRRKDPEFEQTIETAHTVMARRRDALRELGSSAMPMFNPVHPGRIVRQCMDKLTVNAFAKQIGIPRAELSGMLNGKQSISPEVADKLGQVFPNQDAALWLRLQESYDQSQTRKKEALRAAIVEGEESGVASDGVFDRVLAELQDNTRRRPFTKASSHKQQI